MAVYNTAVTVTVTGTAQYIVTNAQEYQIYELQSNGSAFWFKIGAAQVASVAGAGCVYVPAYGGIEVKISNDDDDISVIKDTDEADEGVTASLVTP